MTKNYGQCVFINLDRSTARRKHMENQFRELGIDARRFPAIDGARRSIEELKELNPQHLGAKPLSTGEIGCYLSHMRVWEIVANGQHRHVAVFEDDVRFAPGISKILKDLSWIPDDVDFIKLDTTDNEVLVSKTRRVPLLDRELVQTHTVMGGASAYIISQRAAKDFLSRSLRMDAPVDTVMFAPEFQFHSDLAYWQVRPALSLQQCRDEHQFLSEDAEVSIIEQTRKGKRSKPEDHFFHPSIPFQLKRLVTRPARILRKLRIERHLKMLIDREGANWVRIRFKE